MKQVQLAILKMLGSFPQTAGDAEMMLASFLETASNVDEKAALEACERFRLGKLNRNHAFAPSVAEFSKEAGELQEWYKKEEAWKQDRRFLPKPNIPLSERLARVRSEFAGREVLAEGVSHEEFIKGARRKMFPTKSTYVAALQTVFAPASLIQQQREA